MRVSHVNHWSVRAADPAMRCTHRTDSRPSNPADSQAHQEPHQARFPGSTTRLLDGRAAAAEWEEELRGEVAEIRRVAGRPPGLAVVLVGDRPDSHLYVHRKREACARVRSC